VLAVARRDADLDVDGPARVADGPVERAAEGVADLERGQVLEGERDAVTG
jgi:hypothetical protein